MWSCTGHLTANYRLQLFSHFNYDKILIVNSCCYILQRCSVLTVSPKYLRFTNFSILSLKGKIINHLFCVCEMSWHLCLYCNLHNINSTNVIKYSWTFYSIFLVFLCSQNSKIIPLSNKILFN